MALLLRPERWLIKPPPGTPLDPSHPLANGLRLYLPFNEGGGAARDVVTGRLAYVPTTNGTWGTVAGGGVGMRTTVAGASGNLAYDAQWAIPFPLTIWFYGTQRNATYGDQSWFGVQTSASGVNGYGVYHASADSTEHVFLAGGGVFTDISIGALAANRPYGVAMTYDGANLRGWVDGVQKVSGARTGAVTYVAGAFQVGNEGDSAPVNNGISDALAFGIWNRILSAAELHQLSAAPYAMLAPHAVAHKFFIPPSGVAPQNLVGSAQTDSSASAALTITPAAAQSLVGSASSVSSASATLTLIPATDQNLVGSASSASSASGVFTSGSVAQNLVGSASSASSASATLTLTPAAAQNLIGAASSASSASAAITETPSSTVQHLVGSASSASSASGALSNSVSGAGVSIQVASAGSGGEGFGQSLVRDSNNRLWVATYTAGPADNSGGFYTTNTLRIHKADQTGVPSTFTEQDTAHRPVAVGTFAIAIDSSDLIHVAWVHTYVSPGAILYQTFNTTTNLWVGSPVTIGTLNSASSTDAIPGDEGVSLVLDANGAPHVLHYGRIGSTSGAYHIWYTNKTSGSWSTAVQIDTATLGTNFRCMHPQIAFDSTGALHATWMTYTFNYQIPSDGTAYYCKRSAAGTWGTPVAFAQTLLGSVDNGPSLYVDYDDTVHIAYNLGDTTTTQVGNNNVIYYRFSTDGGATWNTSQQPAKFVTHDPIIGPDGFGGVYLWCHSQPATYDGVGGTIGRMHKARGAISWGAWTAVTSGTPQMDATVSARRQQWFTKFVNYLDVAYFNSDTSPITAYVAVDPGGNMLVGQKATAASASSASAVLSIVVAGLNLTGAATSASSATAALTETPQAAQSLIGSGASASSASATLTQTPAAVQALVGTASSATAATAALTETTPAGAYVGTASSASAAGATLTITPSSAALHLVGTAASTSAASGALTETPVAPMALVGSAASASSASTAIQILSNAQLLAGSAASFSAASAILTQTVAGAHLLTGTAASSSSASAVIGAGIIVYGTVTLTDAAVTTVGLSNAAVTVISLTDTLV